MAAEFEFKNLAGHPIWLPGPDGSALLFTKFESKVLSEWFLRYVPRHLKMIRQVNASPHHIISINPRLREMQKTPLTVVRTPITTVPPRPVSQRPVPPVPQRSAAKKIPGRFSDNAQAATQQLSHLLENITFSNDIGIGILSFNRLNSVRRCLESIYKHTDLSRVTVFVSDESTDIQTLAYLRQQKNIVLTSNKHQGVASNSNRLLYCLARFQYKFLLNDDIEILRDNWCDVYVKALQKTGLHHFCFRQNGVLRANPSQEGKIHSLNGINVWTINERPQGVCLVFDDKAFKTVGYFDEGFNPYGMEHVDWSHRVWLSGIQEAGYHDIIGSNDYLRLYNEPTAMPERAAMLATARKRFEQIKDDRSRIYIKPVTVCSTIDRGSVIIPFRGHDRYESILSVIQNIKAQKLPIIDIVLVEQDNALSLKLPELSTLTYLLAPNSFLQQPFCKAAAFNKGVMNCSFNKVILHDADMVVHNGYLPHMSELLDKYNAVHIGQQVVYLDKPSTETVNKTQSTKAQYRAERIVSYFEGGSLGITRDAYMKIGGFDERFKGYGMEDIEFFNRLHLLNFYNQRSVDLLHLWHARTPGWNECHRHNKELGHKLMQRSAQVRANELHGLLVKQY